MCNLLGHSERRDGAGRRIFADVGGSAWRRVGVLGSRACYKAYKLAHKQTGGGMKFTKGAGWSELQRNDVGGEVVRRRWAELRGQGGLVVLLAPGLLGSVRGDPAAAVEESA
jgi:hypothetical protein